MPAGFPPFVGGAGRNRRPRSAHSDVAGARERRPKPYRRDTAPHELRFEVALGGRAHIPAPWCARMGHRCARQRVWVKLIELDGAVTDEETLAGVPTVAADGRVPHAVRTTRTWAVEPDLHMVPTPASNAHWRQRVVDRVAGCRRLTVEPDRRREGSVRDRVLADPTGVLVNQKRAAAVARLTGRGRCRDRDQSEPDDYRGATDTRSLRPPVRWAKGRRWVGFSGLPARTVRGRGATGLPRKAPAPRPIPAGWVGHQIGRATRRLHRWFFRRKRTALTRAVNKSLSGVEAILRGHG